VGTVVQYMQRGHEHRHQRWDRIARAALLAPDGALQAQGISQRQAAQVLEVPRTTRQAWRTDPERRDSARGVPPRRECTAGARDARQSEHAHAGCNVYRRSGPGGDRAREQLHWVGARSIGTGSRHLASPDGTSSGGSQRSGDPLDQRCSSRALRLCCTPSGGASLTGPLACTA
jgi:hypothetical protein